MPAWPWPLIFAGLFFGKFIELSGPKLIDGGMVHRKDKRVSNFRKTAFVT
jgi:hypothetical protein